MTQVHFDDPVPVEHALIRVDQKAANRAPLDDPTDEVLRVLTVTRFSRQQLLKGLAAATAVAMLPSLPAKSALAQTGTGTTSNASGPDLAQQIFMDRFRNQMLYLGYGNSKGSKALLMRETLVLGLTGLAYKANPNQDPLTWESYISDVRKAADLFIQGRNKGYENWGAGRDFFNSMFEVIGEIDPGGRIEVPLGPMVRELWKRGPDRWIGNHMDSMAAKLASQRQYDFAKDFQSLVDGVLQYTMENTSGDNSARYREAVDRILVGTGLPFMEDIHNANQKDAVVKLLESILKNQDTQFQTMIEQMIHLDGSFSGKIDDLKAILQKVFEDIKVKMDEQSKVINETNALQIGEAAKRRQQAAREAARQLHEQQIAGLNASVYLLSTLIGFGDKKLGEQVRVVGSAAVQIYDTIWKFASGVIDFGDGKFTLDGFINQAFSMGGAIAAGNIVGVVMNLISFFGSQGSPSPEQMILDQIKELQGQVQRLHQDMHERFDRIEKYLDAIYGGINALFDLVNARFNEIRTDLDAVRNSVYEIQQQLVRQELLLNRLAAGMHKGLQDGFRHDFNTALNQALGYNERNTEPMSSRQFSDFEAQFYTWAINTSKNDNEMPLAGRRYEDEDVLLELNSYPLEENIMYLSEWLRQKTGHQLTSVPLANPLTWHISAEAYGQLRVEQPKYADTAGYLDHNAHVDAEGKKVSSAVRRITVKQETNGVPEPNYELFDWLIANYKKQVEQLDGAPQNSLQAFESEVLTKWKTSAPLEGFGRAPGDPDIDPWGGLQQEIDHKPAFPSNAPSNILSFVPTPYLLADYMKLDDPALSMRFLPEWIDLQGDPESEEGQTAKLKVTVKVEYKGTPILARHVAGDRRYTTQWKQCTFHLDIEICRTRSFSAGAAFSANWEGGENLKARFEAFSQETSPTDAEKLQREQLLSDVTNRVEDKLRKLREAIYSKILEELAPGQSLDVPTRKLDGAKALIDRFVNLGMPIAIESDDFLRALLYGTESLVDLRQVKERYSGGNNERSSTNDDFADAREISGESVSVEGTTKAATREVGEPDHSSDTDGFSWLGDHSVWYSWTTPASGSVTLDTCAAEIDSILAVYTGDSLSGLSRVADDNNGCGGGWGSKVTFDAEADTTYRIAVADAGGLREGAFTLNLLFKAYGPYLNPRESLKNDALERADALYKPGPDANNPGQGATGALAEYLHLIGEKKYFDGQTMMIDSTLLRSRAIFYVIKWLNEPEKPPADTTAPTVSSVSPANRATNVARNTNVTATFSEPMDKATLTTATFRLVNAITGKRVGASVKSSADGKKVTLDPSVELLAKGTTYKATIIGAKDQAGNALAKKVWSFTTGKR